MSRSLACFCAAAALALAAADARAATIALAPVGNPGNAPNTRVMTTDSTTGYGRVNYSYSIGKYEVTTGQYAEFLNAVARIDDPNSLWTGNIADGYLACGISRSGTAGNYVYTVTRNANYPVNYVSVWDACRFANWLQNGQPTNVEQVAGTTETGAYDLTDFWARYNNTVTRTAGASWAVASEDEWYKAAYYDPNKAGGAGYWFYPTRSDTTPSNALSDATTNPNGANFGRTPQQGDVTAVGTFAASPSAYGTFDQGGNLYEWNDTIINVSYRGFRGGAAVFASSQMQSDIRYWDAPAGKNYYTGFRVVAVPEPMSVGLLGIASLIALRRKRAGGNQGGHVSMGG